MTSPFFALAQAVAKAEHMADACFVAVPGPLGMIAESDVVQKAEDSFAEIMKLATGWQPRVETVATKHAYPAERFEFSGTISELNAHFIERGWSLGLPIIPPTVESVGRMLEGTSRRPDEILGQVPPKMGTLTIELLATHAVMAGCQPKFMPVLIAAMEGLLKPEANWRSALSTTGTSQTVVIVNGPVVKETGIGYGQGAAGKGHHANGSIGYAINLIAYTVGGSRPPSIDCSTLGSPADYVCWVFGENEDALPAGWEPLHVQMGFKRSDSVVTVFCSYPPPDNIDHWSVDTKECLRWWQYISSPMQSCGAPCSTTVLTIMPVVALGPEHAQLIASQGWTRKDFTEAFWENVRIPLSAWPRGCPDVEKLKDYLGPLTPDSMIPITLKAEQVLTVIAGGSGKHSHYFPPFPGCLPVSTLAR